MNRQAWGSDEVAEYDDLLADVVATTTVTRERLDRFERLLTDAVQAQRPWARDVERTCLRDGLAAEIKRYQDRMRQAFVTHDGRLLNEPRVQGRKVRTVDGEVIDDRALIEVWTWDQVLDKRREAIRARAGYTQKIALYDRLLALRDFVPDSTSPADAVARLGVTIDDYLGEPPLRRAS